LLNFGQAKIIKIGLNETRLEKKMEMEEGMKK
jgi:hypothetical protein